MTAVWRCEPRSHKRNKADTPLPGRRPSVAVPHRSAPPALCPCGHAASFPPWGGVLLSLVGCFPPQDVLVSVVGRPVRKPPERGGTGARRVTLLKNSRRVRQTCSHCYANVTHGAGGLGIEHCAFRFRSAVSSFARVLAPLGCAAADLGALPLGVVLCCCGGSKANGSNGCRQFRPQPREPRGWTQRFPFAFEGTAVSVPTVLRGKHGNRDRNPVPEPIFVHMRYGGRTEAHRSACFFRAFLSGHRGAASQRA